MNTALLIVLLIVVNVSVILFIMNRDRTRGVRAGNRDEVQPPVQYVKLTSAERARAHERNAARRARRKARLAAEA